MFKKTVAIVTMALLAIPAASLAATQNDFRWDGTEPICTPLPVSLGEQDIHIGSTHYRLPGRTNFKACVTSDSKVDGTPTVTPYSSCGTTCFAVRVADISAYKDLNVEVTYQEDGQSKSIGVDPEPIDVGRELEEVCISNHDAGTPDPCLVHLTSPSNLKAKGAKRQVSLRWTPGGEAYGRNVQTTYEVWRGTGTELEAFEMIAAGVTEPAFLDSGLARRAGYSYFVVAVDADGNRSGGSNVAQGTTT